MPRPNKNSRKHPPSQAEGILNEADRLLSSIGQTKSRLVRLTGRYQEDLAALESRYQEIGELEDRLGALDRDLTALMKTNRAVIFFETDKVYVRSGRLLMGLEVRVVIPRTALARIKALGWIEGLTVTEKVNRGAVEGWSEERLEAVGAGRREVSRFSYETGDMKNQLQNI